MQGPFEVHLPARQWLDLLPDAALIADSDGRILRINNKTLDLFGYCADELIGQPVEILVPERLRSAHAGHQKKFFAHPLARPMGLGQDLLGRRKDGSEFPAEISISPMPADGHTLVWAIIRDVSDRKKAEADLRDRESRLRLIFDSTSDLEILYRVEPGNRLVVQMINQAMNRVYRNLRGRDATEFIGRDLEEFLDSFHFPPEEKEFRLAMYRNVARDKTAVHYTGSAGPRAEIGEATISPILNENGECTHLLWTARVVTDRVRVEAELREREERLRMVFNSHRDLQSLVRVEPDGRFVNEAFNQAMIDYAREFMPDPSVFLGRERTDFLRAMGLEESMVERSLAVWRQVVREKNPLHVEVSSSVGNGKRIEILDVSTVPIFNRDDACTHVLWTAHILTERAHAEEELRKRERELEEAQSIGHIGSWTLDIPEHRLVWSDEVYRILGYEPQSFPPTNLPDFLRMVHPDDRDLVEHQTLAALRAREAHDIDHRIVRPDGSVRFVRSRSRLQLDSAGNPLRMLATIHDVTEEKQAAERETQRLLRLKKLSALSMMLAGDPATVLQRIVGLVGELFDGRGVSLSEIAGDEVIVRAVYINGKVEVGGARGPLDITPCSTVAAARDILTYDRVQDLFPRATYLDLFGAYSWCGFPSLDSDGNVVAVTSIMDDKPREFSEEDKQILRLVGQRIAAEFQREKSQAERARMEERLRENQTRLEQAQHMARLGSWYSADALSGNMEWSPELYRIYEADPAADMAGVDLVLSRTHPDDRARVLANREALLRQTGGFESEYRLQMPDGRIKYVSVQGSVTHQPDGRIQMGGTVQDITERKRAEQERERLQAQLSQSQRMESIGRLAGGVAHDFNNMLTVILGYASLCRSAVEKDPKLQRYMVEIVKAATRSREITEKLLGFSRRQIIAPIPSNLNDLIADLKEPLARLIGEDIDLVFQPCAGLRKVVVDQSQINQILLNLVVNARDAMPNGGKVTIETANVELNEDYCRCHPGAREGRYILLSVSDTGTGMDQETMSHIFEPFFTTKEMEKGTGLGLATVYGIVKQNAGFITVNSEPWRGSTFKIYFPEMQGEPGGAELDAESLAVRTGHGAVLLVEDDDLVRGITKTTLETMGYTPLVASSPQEAIALCSDARSNIRMILTDVVMPGMNGMELGDRVRAVNPSIRVLFMSGYTPSVIVNHGVLKKGVHFIQKPFTMEDLGRRMEEVLSAD